ncbi:lytic transglycosylase domain-containing protein [Accumulibacter sp.]|uniref:lytic transglycosylase domain-containing protein n=1 Tax=Accumulibacter sp. TaxID=2053492 RepID=UPI0025F8CE4E|nr:lytic transglycosylase domain-containing protein [Accumulibacter sp.]MCM8595332.1 lytic transglycosylase domain-containing protein [Accumulibacter sp.]MCM8625287.1 lytic transglycosylase domain-containing protein [Accumulibacter sp.]MDS4049479.1 transglycosylase SLT domain-containing protein [Accumulibacter sp.]
MKRGRVILSILFALLLIPARALAATADEQFLAARDAFRAGDRARLERLAPALEGHELEPYVAYWQLAVDLKDSDPSVIGSFLSRNEGTYIAEKLRSDWLRQLGRKQQWTLFDAEFGRLVQPDQDLACLALQSRLARGDARALDDALPLWLGLLEPPESCYPILEALIVDKRVLVDGVWARIRRQFEANRTAAAMYTMNYLPASQMPDRKVAQAVADTPLPWLAKLPADFSASRIDRELALLAIQRVARNDPRVAADQLQRIGGSLKPGEKAWAWSQIGLQGAQRHLPEAMEWYRQAGDAPLSDEAAEWKVRAALRVQDWAAVRSTIEKMAAPLAAQPAWVYWLGRAYRSGGRTDEANALFAKIAGQPDFYGSLASEELGRQISPPPKAPPVTREELAAVGALPGIQRAQAFFRLNMRSEGVREWNWALRSMTDRELLAASEIALRSGNFDRAIAAADRTRNEHDYSLRYLAPYGDQVRPAARSQDLDDAWVYGLMRQESRFITSAKSPVGASGLMQLMPATAKWVANKIGLKDFHQGKVNDTEVNLLLGTTYMRLVLESLDNHPVLASAAYNAGPGRARRWRADRPLEGAIYAETIPFSETRDYVKKVMNNSIFYAALFDGRPQTLKNRLGVIAPRTGAEAKGEDLP